MPPLPPSLCLCIHLAPHPPSESAHSLSSLTTCVYSSTYLLFPLCLRNFFPFVFTLAGILFPPLSSYLLASPSTTYLHFPFCLHFCFPPPPWLHICLPPPPCLHICLLPIPPLSSHLVISHSSSVFTYAYLPVAFLSSHPLPLCHHVLLPPLPTLSSHPFNCLTFSESSQFTYLSFPLCVFTSTCLSFPFCVFIFT